jgi:hypothetical protein
MRATAVSLKPTSAINGRRSGGSSPASYPDEFAPSAVAIIVSAASRPAFERRG